MGRFFSICLLLLLSVDTLALTMGEAIDIAGRQRMLSQRIAQSYLLLGLQTDVAKYQDRLDGCISEFQNNLDRLSEFPDASTITSQLEQVKRAWAPYKTLAQEPVSKLQAERIINQSNQVLDAAQAYVVSLQKLAKHSSAELVNISGRQRMLSQRIAKNFLAAHWGVSNASGTEALYADLAEFEHMLNYLLDSQYNTDKITQKLQKTQGHFSYATRGFDGEMSIEGKRLVFVITGTTDTMLFNMDEITKLYASVLDNAKQQFSAR